MLEFKGAECAHTFLAPKNTVKTNFLIFWKTFRLLFSLKKPSAKNYGHMHCASPAPIGLTKWIFIIFWLGKHFAEQKSLTYMCFKYQWINEWINHFFIEQLTAVKNLILTFFWRSRFMISVENLKQLKNHQQILPVRLSLLLWCLSLKIFTTQPLP